MTDDEFNQVMSQEDRVKLSRKFKRQILSSLKAADPDRVKLNITLIEEAATYAATITEINMLIQRDGVVDQYQNGENQWGTKKSVPAELKPKYTQIYQSLVKQLSGLLPDEQEKDAAQELLDFINNGSNGSS